jgi:hypothetical protein
MTMAKTRRNHWQEGALLGQANSWATLVDLVASVRLVHLNDWAMVLLIAHLVQQRGREVERWVAQVPLQSLDRIGLSARRSQVEAVPTEAIVVVTT